VITYSLETGLGIGAPFAATLRSAGVSPLRQHRLWPASGPASYDSARAVARGAGAVIFAISAKPVDRRPEAVNMPDSLAALIQSLSDSGTAVITVALGSPYLLNQVPGASAFLAAWSDIEAAQIAAARAIAGLSAVTGRLPISLGPYPIGHGIERTTCCMP